MKKMSPSHVNTTNTTKAKGQKEYKYIQNTQAQKIIITQQIFHIIVHFNIYKDTECLIIRNQKIMVFNRPNISCARKTNYNSVYYFVTLKL